MNPLDCIFIFFLKTELEMLDHKNKQLDSWFANSELNHELFKLIHEEYENPQIQAMNLPHCIFFF